MMDENISNGNVNEQNMTGEDCKSEPIIDENKIGENLVTEPVELNFEEALPEKEEPESESAEILEEGGTLTEESEVEEGEKLEVEVEENSEEVSGVKDEEESETESAENQDEPKVDEEESSEEVAEEKKQENDEKPVDMTQLEHVMPIPKVPCNYQTNRLNVLLLALSIFPMHLEKSTYVMGENENEEFDYFYQMEPIPQMLSNKLGKDGQFLDQVIILYTDDTKNKMHKFINIDGEEIEHSPLSYFKERIKPWLNPNCEDLFYEIEINEDNPADGVAETVHYLRDLRKDNKEVHLYMDEHGGFRSVQLVLQAITSLLKKEVTMEAVYGMKFNGSDNHGKIMDVTNTFNILDLLSDRIKKKEEILDMTQLEHVMPMPKVSCDSRTNRLNVLLLALSTFPMSLKKNRYVTGENDGEKFEYYYQLEPIPQMLSNKLGKDGQFIDRVIILYTDDTKDNKKIFKNTDGEVVEHSPLSYFKERIKPWLNPNCTDLYYEIEINEDNPVKGVAQTVYYLRDLKGDNKEVHLYMDEHGGFRSVQLVLQAITSLLKNEVTMEAVYGMKFNGLNNPGKIMDVTKTFQIFDFVSGINEFINYGRIDSLEHYYNDKLEDSSEIGTRLDGMKRIASGLQLCDTKEYEDGLRIMQKEMETSQENGQKNDEYLDLFEQTIKYDYGNLLGNRKNTEFVLDTVEWCAKKGFLQQALTYIEDKMPKYFLEKEIIKIKSSGADLNNTEVAKKIKKRLGAQPYVTMDNAKFYSLIKQINISEMNKYYRECVSEIVKGYVAPQNLDYKKWLSMKEQEYKDVYEKVWHNLLNLNEKNKCVEKIDALKKKSVNYMNQLTFKGLLENCKEWEEESQKNNIISNAIAACVFDESNHFVRFEKNILLEEDEEIFFNKVNNNCKNVSRLIASNQKNLKNLLTVWIDIRNILKNRVKNKIKESDKAYILPIINYILTYRDNKNNYAFLDLFKEDEIEKAFINTIRDLLLKENDTKENNSKENNSKENSSREQLYQMLNYPRNNFSNLELLETLMDRYVTDLSWTPIEDTKQLLSYDEDKLNDLYKQLIDASEKTVEKKDIIEKYIVYRMKEYEFEKTGKYVTKVSDPKFMEQYLYNENTGKGFTVFHSLMINGLSSETWASLKNEYEYDIKDNDDKLVTFTITIPNKVDRKKLQDVLLLHAALKYERNNSNHASEKGERVPAKIVKYMILQYVDMCRQLK